MVSSSKTTGSRALSCLFNLVLSTLAVSMCHGNWLGATEGTLGFVILSERIILFPRARSRRLRGICEYMSSSIISGGGTEKSMSLSIWLLTLSSGSSMWAGMSSWSSEALPDPADRLRVWPEGLYTGSLPIAAMLDAVRPWPDLPRLPLPPRLEADTDAQCIAALYAPAPSRVIRSPASIWGRVWKKQNNQRKHNKT